MSTESNTFDPHRNPWAAASPSGPVYRQPQSGSSFTPITPQRANNFQKISPNRTPISNVSNVYPIMSNNTTRRLSFSQTPKNDRSWSATEIRSSVTRQHNTETREDYCNSVVAVAIVIIGLMLIALQISTFTTISGALLLGFGLFYAQDNNTPSNTYVVHRESNYV